MHIVVLGLFWNFDHLLRNTYIRKRSETKLEKIQKAQRRTLRATFFKNKYDSVGYMSEQNKLDCVHYICNGVFQRCFQAIKNGIRSQFTYWRLPMFLLYKKKPVGTTNNYLQSHCRSKIDYGKPTTS